MAHNNTPEAQGTPAQFEALWDAMMTEGAAAQEAAHEEIAALNALLALS